MSWLTLSKNFSRSIAADTLNPRWHSTGGIAGYAIAVPMGTTVQRIGYGLGAQQQDRRRCLGLVNGVYAPRRVPPASGSSAPLFWC